MAKKITTVVQILGELDPSLKNAFQSVQRSAKETNKNLRATNRALKLDPTNFSLITQKQQYLQQATVATKKKLDDERQALASLKASNAPIEQQRKLEREIAETTAAYQRLRREAINYYSDTGNRFHQLAGWQKQTGDKLTQMGRSAMKISGPALAVMGWSGKVSADFGAKMSKVKAITGETGKGFQELRQYAIQMGNDTIFSASQVADAMSDMGMMGWKRKDIKSGGKGVLNLAAASGMSPADTAKIVSSGLTSFKMPVKQATTLANQLAAAATNSGTDIREMGEALKYVGPIAGASNYTSKQTIEALGQMANAGIKGSQAGTSLKAIMTGLNKDVTFYNSKLGEVTVRTTNANGTMRNFSDVIADLKAKTEGMTQSEKLQLATHIAGQRGYASLLQLMNEDSENLKKNKQLRDALNNADKGKGAATQMAETMQQNIPAQLTLLKSKAQTAAIQMFDAMTPSIMKLLEFANTAFDKFNENFKKMPDGLKNFAGKAMTGLALFGPALLALGKIHSLLAPISDTIGNLLGKGKLLKDIFTGGSIFGGLGEVTKSLAGEGMLGKVASFWEKHSANKGGLFAKMFGAGKESGGFAGLSRMFSGLEKTAKSGGMFSKITGMFSKLGNLTKEGGALGKLTSVLGGGAGGLLSAIPGKYKLIAGGIAAMGVAAIVAAPKIKKMWDAHKDKSNAKKAVKDAANAYATAKVKYEAGTGSKEAMDAASKSYTQLQNAYTKKYGKPVKVKAKATVSTEEEIKTAKKKAKVDVDVSDANSKIKRAASTGESQKAKITITADTSGVYNQIKILNNDLQTLKSNAKKVKVTVDTADSSKKIKTLKGYLKDLKDKKIKVSTSGGSQIKKIKDNVSKIKNKNVKVKASVSGEKKVQNLQTTLKKTKSKTVSVKVKVTGSKGAAKELQQAMNIKPKRITIPRPNTSTALNAVRRMRSNIRSVLASISHIHWRISKPAIPHFSMSGTFNPQTGAVPHINVSWHASAMQLGKILKSPTIFGMGRNGQLLGAGEAGDEAVVGTSSLYRMVQRAAQSAIQPVDSAPQWLKTSMELERNPVYLDSPNAQVLPETTPNIEMGGITFAPNITMAPSETQPEDVIRAMKRYMPQFMDQVQSELRRREDGRLVSENAGL